MKNISRNYLMVKSQFLFREGIKSLKIIGNSLRLVSSLPIWTLEPSMPGVTSMAKALTCLILVTNMNGSRKFSPSAMPGISIIKDVVRRGRRAGSMM